MRLWPLFALVPSLALSQAEADLRELMHARNYAMGGAYRALGLGAESVYGNPASLALYKRYQVELSGALDTSVPFGFGTLSVVDSATSDVAGGVSYHFVSLGRGEGRTVAHLSTLSFALPLSGAVHLGVSGHHALFAGASEGNVLTGDAGLLIRPTPSLTVSFSGHNLIDTQREQLPRYFVLSSGLVAGLLSIAADVQSELGNALNPSYAAGIEYIVGQATPLRAGYTYDSRRGTHLVSAGLGLLTEGGGIDLAYRHELGGAQSRLFALTLKVQVR